MLINICIQLLLIIVYRNTADVKYYSIILLTTQSQYSIRIKIFSITPRYFIYKNNLQRPTLVFIGLWTSKSCSTNLSKIKFFLLYISECVNSKKANRRQIDFAPCGAEGTVELGEEYRATERRNVRFGRERIQKREKEVK